MIKLFKKNEGAIIIEASISLIAFMFAIVTLYSVVNICIVQAKVSAAINSTAKELSEYTYLYSLTGIRDSLGEVAKNGEKTSNEITGSIGDIKDVFTAIDDIKKGTTSSDPSIDKIIESAKNGKSSADSVLNQINSWGDDPKSFIFGLASMATSDLSDALSKAIACKLSELLCDNHLVSKNGGSTELYLKSLGVVPDGTGSYYGGLDFSNSSLFLKGSNEIKVDVEYDVKVLPLLPIDYTFHFHQVAITQGWSAGDIAYEELENYVKNNTIWTDATPDERASLIRHQVIEEYKDEGYSQVSGSTHMYLYNPNSDPTELVSITSMNPFDYLDGEDTKKAEDIKTEDLEAVLTKRALTTLNSKTDQTTIKSSDGKKTTVDTRSSQVVLEVVIPEDSGLKEKFEEAAKNVANETGVEIRISPSYGNGAKESVAEKEASN